MGSAASSSNGNAAAAAAPASTTLPAAPKRRGSISSIQIPSAVTPKTAQSVMDTIVTDSRERKLFETFLSGEYCDEIIHFWKATETFQRQALKLARVKGGCGGGDGPGAVDAVRLTHKHVLKSAEAIYDKYLAPGAPEPVNVSAKVAKEIKADLDGGGGVPPCL